MKQSIDFKRIVSSFHCSYCLANYSWKFVCSATSL